MVLNWMHTFDSQCKMFQLSVSVFALDCGADVVVMMQQIVVASKMMVHSIQQISEDPMQCCGSDILFPNQTRKSYEC